MSQYGAYGMALAGATAPEILRHFYTGADVAPARDDVDVRVNVVHRAATVELGTTAVAPGGGGLRLQPDAGPPVVLAAGDTVALTATSGALVLQVTRGSGGTDAPVTAAGVSVRWPGTRALPGPATTLDVRSSGAARTVRSYRWGSLRVTPVGGGVDAVAVLDVHGEYLRGVAEMPFSWPAAALQAQVVAARGYALDAAAHAPRVSCGGCQLWDDTRSLVYRGWSAETQTSGGVRWGDRWTAAVAATEPTASTGLAVLVGGRPVTTPFASSTGGRTRDVEDVWGTPVSWLRSVPDPWSLDPAINPGFARWTRTIGVPQLLALFGLPDLVSVEVTRRDRGGAALALTGTAADGRTATVGGPAFTARFGLPAAWVAAVALPGPSAGTPATRPSAAPTPTGTTPTGTALTGAASPAPSPTPMSPAEVSSPAPPSGADRPPAAVVPAGLPVQQWQPGEHTVDGRRWSTTCRATSTTAWRCDVQGWTTRWVRSGRTWVPRTGWVADRTVWFDSDLTAWAGDARASAADRTASSSGGRRLRTTCTAASGARACTTRTLTTAVARVFVRDRPRFVTVTAWTVSEVVHLGGK